MKAIRLFFIGAACLVLGSAYAQRLAIGVKGGVNFQNVSAPDVLEDATFLPEFQSIAGPHAGLVAELELTPAFALQPELNYTVKGFKLQDSYGIELFQVPLPLGVSALTRLHYLEMPLLAKVKMGNERAHLYFAGGPTVGYALKGTLETRADFLVEWELFETPLDLNELGANRLEWGLVGGVGAGVQAGPGTFFADFRYSHGLSEVYDIPLVRERVQNRGFSLSTGYLLNF